MSAVTARPGVRTERTTTVRTPSWATTTALAFVVLGAALVNLALVGDQGGSALLAVPLVLGLAELGLALVALRGGRVPAGRTVGPVLAAAGAGWLALAGALHEVIGTADAAAALLQVGAGVAVTIAARRADARSGSSPRASVPSGRRTAGQLSVLLLTAVVVASVAGAGMSATPAGSEAHMPGMPAMHDQGGMQDMDGMHGMHRG
ncbi:hypothetical protein [Luteimicrobium subarcticum]|uniref:Uncharacterized protein n=1 Tax=Luteimicrobium subarcticum TaxID=620910 RepID=A0A2M8WRP5_9MICO|nr:hypothetical protein [Luteimicrobium subarcticum]PJI93620.1 hypothetical protein CLV34_1093 [Luteimicrobium subarcticum]